MTEANTKHDSFRSTGTGRRRCSAPPLAALLLVLVGAAPSAGQDEGGTTHEFPLAFVERFVVEGPAGMPRHLILDVDWDGGKKYLPDIADHPVRRGAIRLGEDAAIRLAWDDSLPRLWIDFDRDEDLTDEEPVSLQREGVGLAARSLEVHGPEGGRWIVDVWIPGTVGNVWGTQVTVLSGWAGEITLGDRRYTLAVANDLRGKFTADDWLVVRAENGTPLVPDPMALPRRLHLGGMLYDLALRHEGDAVVATFTEVDELGEACRFTGRHVAGLSLVQSDDPSGPVVALLDELPCTARLPAGEYEYTVRIDGGENLGSLVARGTWTIRAGEENVVALGAPLDNQITVERVAARTLRLGHRLLGGEGEEYVLRKRLNDGPDFTATSGGRSVGEGTSRYG